MRLVIILLAASLPVGSVAQAKAGGGVSKLRASVRNFFLPSEGSYSGLQQRLAAVAIAGVSCGAAGCTPYEAATAVAVFSPLLSEAIDNRIEAKREAKQERKKEARTVYVDPTKPPLTKRKKAMKYMTEQQLDRYRSILADAGEYETIRLAMEKSGDHYIFYFGEPAYERKGLHYKFAHWIDHDGEVYALPWADHFLIEVPKGYFDSTKPPLTPPEEAMKYMTEQQLDRYRSILAERGEHVTIRLAMEKSGDDHYIFYFGERFYMHGRTYIEFVHWIEPDGEVYRLPWSDHLYIEIPEDY